MKTQILCCALFFACVSYASGSVLGDALGLDCMKEEVACNAISKPCCGQLQCFFPHGYHPRSPSGYCVQCVGRNQPCQRDNQCCEGTLCQKQHLFHLNGVCTTLHENGVKCYKDSQCLSNHCKKPHWWHMYGRCTDDSEERRRK